jgi:perosamine synthetase
MVTPTTSSTTSSVESHLTPKKVPLSRPSISQMEIDAVTSVLKSGRLSRGQEIINFENEIAKKVGVKYGIAVSSGTAALHLSLMALGIKEGDEVITTPLTFISTANVILYCNATPVFVDCKKGSLNIDPEKVRSAITPKTKAILGVDTFGFPADWEQLRSIANEHNISLIEDSAGAFGSYVPKSDNSGAIISKKYCGSFGDCSILSFYPNKQITTAEGGMVLTNDDQLAEEIRSFRNQAVRVEDGTFIYSKIGYNYRLSDVHATIGKIQLQRFDELQNQRNKIKQHYQQLLKDHESITVLESKNNVSLFTYVLLVKKEIQSVVRNELFKRGIENSSYYPVLHLQPVYSHLGYKKGDFPNSEHISECLIDLPFFSSMTFSEVEHVVKTFKEIISSLSSGGKSS